MEELQAIKKLLLLGLLNQGVTQESLGVALGVTQATISRMLPARKVSRKKK